ncbi:PTS sugar transporter subunit IIB [Clostridium polynesiense]|uniref:PTS sugar transporter subunit IIB n=1 Tax=Clostridium polynesiense TaxID=1325933 RepID=UPI0006931CF4|nr:PTS sugar transporter subunit IIB [Clostridium polynesiense]
MIKLLRVDDKLLHGQVAFSWIRNLKIHTLIIADDRVSGDEFLKMTLGLSKPPGVNLSIIELSTAIEVLKDKSCDKMNVMVIVSNVYNAKRITDALGTIKAINLGSIREHKDSRYIKGNIYLDDEEIKLCRQLEEQGIAVEIAFRYEDEKKRFDD